VVSFGPAVLRAGIELLLKVCLCINPVKVRVHFTVDLGSTDLALMDPQKPLFLVEALQQLHPNELVLACSAEGDVRQSELNGVIFIDCHILEITLAIDFYCREDLVLRLSLAESDFLDKLVEFALTRFDHFFVGIVGILKRRTIRPAGFPLGDILLLVVRVIFRINA
jgi:hypothetical protein